MTARDELLAAADELEATGGVSETSATAPVLAVMPRLIGMQVADAVDALRQAADDTG